MVNGGDCSSETRVWTGTTQDGTLDDGNDDCDDWTTSSLTQDGTIGSAHKINQEWTDANCTTVTCDQTARIYCFEQP